MSTFSPAEGLEFSKGLPLGKRRSCRVPPRTPWVLRPGGGGPVGSRPTAVLDCPLRERRSCRVPPRRAAPFLVRTRNGGKKPQGAAPP